MTGYWLAGRQFADAPIVLLGSEGDFTTLAPNLEALLARIALGDFGDKGPAADFLHSDEDYGEGVAPDLRGDMQAFLREQTGVPDLESLAHAAVPHPSEFAEWVERSAETYTAQMRAHPAIVAITSLLEKYRPVNGEPRQSTMINLRWVGALFEAWVAPAGPSLAEAEQLKVHLATLRDEAAAKVPGLGLWHRATLTVDKEQLTFMADYLYEPEFRSAKPSANDFRADQARAPRAARRIPDWLATILSS